jgi:hypothetical protein
MTASISQRQVTRVTLAPTLADYRRHAELFGTELVIETAVHDLQERELADLRAYLKHLEATKRFHRGRWHDRRIAARACEECGLDLPANASSRMRFHAHCRARLKKRRQRQRIKADCLAAQGGDSARSGWSALADRGAEAAVQPTEK